MAGNGGSAGAIRTGLATSNDGEGSSAVGLGSSNGESANSGVLRVNSSNAGCVTSDNRASTMF